MAIRDIIVIGASAGGVEALSGLVSRLPAGLPASVFVTIHFPPHGISVLARILTRAGPLPAEQAKDGQPFTTGRIYIASPDHHMLIGPDEIRLDDGPAENGNRPAIDPMFRSAAAAFGPRVIGVVLTGNLDDGTAGLLVVKRHGGIVIIQDPADAKFPSMPQAAMDHVEADAIVPLHDIPALLLEYSAGAIASAARLKYSG